jgi:uncharacterized phage-associated protein
MANVLTVAKYILERQGQITTLKLQKLVYYAQVWAISDDGEALFPDAIKAWAQGPVVPALFHHHKGMGSIAAADLGSVSGELTEMERACIDRTLSCYGALPAEYLSELTHHERPWKDARESGQSVGHQSPPILVSAIRDFYKGKAPDDLEADYQLSVSRALMDKHAESLARLAL